MATPSFFTPANAASALSGLAGVLPGGTGCAGAAVVPGAVNAWLGRGSKFSWSTVAVRALSAAIVASLSQGAHTLKEKRPLNEAIGLIVGAGVCAMAASLGGAWIASGHAAAQSELPVSTPAGEPH